MRQWEEVQEVLWELIHAPPRMCERHYAHLAREARVAIIDKLRQVLGVFTPETAPKKPKGIKMKRQPSPSPCLSHTAAPVKVVEEEVHG